MNTAPIHPADKLVKSADKTLSFAGVKNLPTGNIIEYLTITVTSPPKRPQEGSFGGEI